MPSTVSPCRRWCSIRCEPKKPAAPVTRTFMRPILLSDGDGRHRLGLLLFDAERCPVDGDELTGDGLRVDLTDVLEPELQRLLDDPGRHLGDRGFIVWDLKGCFGETTEDRQGLRLIL